MDERPEVGELAARGGMEGRCLHLRQPERVQPMAHLGRGLLGEGHDQRLLRVDRLGGRRVRDAMADDAGLAGSGAGEDDDRAGRGRGRLALLVVQAGQDGLGIHPVTVAARRLPPMTQAVALERVIPPPLKSS